MATVSTSNEAPAYWSGVFAMTLCVFALIASEFMPVSLLTPMAVDLRISEGMAGQGIAISGAFAVLTSLSISWLARTLDRKLLLLSLAGLMAVSGLIVGLAPDYQTYMVGRALIGVVIGGFWAMSAATAMRLVPAAQVPKALAIFNGGNALATVVAAPLGSYLGSIIGWRGAFFCVVPVAAIALVWMLISLPPMPVEPRKPGSGNVFKLFKNRSVALGMAGCAAFFMGQFALFTRIAPLVGSIRRLKWRTSVDLPEPDRPMITKISPVPMLSDRSLTPTTQPVSASTWSLVLPWPISASASLERLPKILNTFLTSILLTVVICSPHAVDDHRPG